MTELLIGLIVVVVVVIIVILAVRNRRAEDPEEFDSPRGGRASRDGRDWRDYDPRERSRHPGRDARSGLRQEGGPRRPAASRTDRGYDDQRRTRPRDGRRSGEGAYGARPDHGFQAGRDQQRSRRGERSNSDSGPQRRPEAPVPSRTRQTRSKRSDDSADWPSTEWDKLSDVDYWAELASDKPLTTTARPAARRDARSGPGPGERAEARPGADNQAPGRAAATGLPVRNHQQMGVAPQLAAAPVPVSAPVPSNVMPLPAGPRPTAAVEPPRSSAVGHGLPPASPRGPVGSDDDPLTSPSFPRVPASDSRSYRTSRPNSHAQDLPDAAYGAPTQQFASYGPADPAVTANRANPPSYPDPLTAPGRYQDNGDAGSAAGMLPPASGNPYGSYVSSSPSGGFPAAGPAGPGNGYGPGPGSYPPADDLSGHGYLTNGHASGRNGHGDRLNGHSSISDGHVDGLNGHGSSLNGHGRHGNGLNGAGGGWYPQHDGLPAGGGAGGYSDRGIDAQGRGPRRDDGHYYPADGLPPSDYPAGQPGAGYLPGGYPPAPHDLAPPAQDPYEQGTHGDYPGYGTSGR